ncbi:hypothetical protein PHAVU_006G054400 [Phaseolus vulgaris]|uniref:SET domain-containing protein n=1 Tax=Phaseolus vulgaris TaxID=3885 RepID=V7BPU3_PHAVU|nr:hypothetical protein PHAVU_006G054400g [Phaseolus vulgaris]ESW18601.1 hypothetical protein PHAVU_006G054400g [Phaseolus vulgaris]
MLGEIFNFVINKLERGNLVLKNSMQAISPMWVILKVMESVEKVFTNASKCVYVGRFTNHSCSSNLRVKDVMYDHNDKNLPYKLFGKLINSSSNSCYWGTPKGNGQIYI